MFATVTAGGVLILLVYIAWVLRDLFEQQSRILVVLSELNAQTRNAPERNRQLVQNTIDTVGAELKRAAALIKAEQQRAAVEAMFRPKG